MTTLNPLAFGQAPGARPSVPDSPSPDLLLEVDRLEPLVSADRFTFADAIRAVCRQELPADQADTAANVAIRAVRRSNGEAARSADRAKIAASLPRVRAYVRAWRRRDAEEIGRLRVGQPGRN